MKRFVRTPNMYTLEAVVDCCAKKGIHFHLTTTGTILETYGETSCVNLDDAGGGLSYAPLSYYQNNPEVYQELSLPEFFELMSVPQRIRHIAGHEIRDVASDGFKIGCKSVTWEECERVMKLRPSE